MSENVEPPAGYQPTQFVPPVSGQPALPAVPWTDPQAGYGQPGYGYAQPGYAAPGGYQVPPGYAAPGYPAYDQYGRPLSDKTKLIAGILGIALGGFGAGRFYTGHTGMAVAQLLVTIFTCGLGHFWGLIDGVMVLVNGGTDAQGRVLRDR